MLKFHGGKCLPFYDLKINDTFENVDANVYNEPEGLQENARQSSV